MLLEQLYVGAQTAEGRAFMPRARLLAGSRFESGLKAADLVRVAKARVADICREEPTAG
jgi:hypothetical protein